MREIHKLLLAQNWVPSIVTCLAMNVIESNDNNRIIFANSNENNRKSSNSNNNSSGYKSQVCLKIANGFHYVNDPHVWGFYRACLEYFLEKSCTMFLKVKVTRIKHRWCTG